MRRTALLVSAALLTSLLPLAVARAADDPPPVPVDRFEGEVPFANPPEGGLFTWGSDTDDPPTLRLSSRDDAPEGDQVLSGTYDIRGYGGFTHDFAFAEPAHDWSAHRGIRLWWEGQDNGKKVALELKDGGANGEASELWTTSFTDDFTGWKQIEIPFTDFAYRTDYQPVGGIDHVLGLTQMWGYAVTLPVGAPGQFALDGVELYGRADQSLRASVLTDSAVYPVREGGTAAVKVTVATTGSAPIDEPVTVAYETAGGSASTSDYTPSRASSPSPRAPPPAPPGPCGCTPSRTRRPPRPPRPSPSSSPSPAPRPPPRPRRSSSTRTGCRI